MAELKLDIVVDNLNKLKKKLEGIQVGKKSTDRNSGGGSKGGKGGMVGLAVGIGAAVALLGQLVSSIDSVVGLLDVIGGLINSLVAPFVPILIGLIKPVFILLNIFLTKFLKLLGVGGDDSGTDKFGNIASLLAGAVAGVVAVLAGFKVALAVAIAALVAVIGKEAFKIGVKIGEKLANFVSKFIVEPLSNLLANLIMWLGKITGIDIAEFIITAFERLSSILSNLWDFLGNILTGNFKEAGQNLLKIIKTIWLNLKDTFSLFVNLLKVLFVKVVDVVKNVWNNLIDGLKNIVNKLASGLLSIVNGIIRLANMIPGVNMDRVRGSTPFSDVGRRTTGDTTINFNVQGDASENTAMLAAELLRRDLNRRGSF